MEEYGVEFLQSSKRKLAEIPRHIVAPDRSHSLNWGRLPSWEIDLHCRQISLLFKHGRFFPGRSIQGISISRESICEQYQKTPLTGLKIALIEELVTLELELTCTNN